MHFEIKKTEQSSRWLEQASWLVLLLGCILSLSVWGLAGHRLQAEEDARFHRAATEIHNQLEQQMDHYLDVLGGFQVMFQVSDQVDREVFHRHFLSLDAPHEYPALLAVQYAPVVHESDRAALEAAVRADRSVDPAGYPHFQITPPGTRAAYLPVVFNEPMAGNEPVFGFDLMTRALMQEVLAEARDSGEARLSRPVSLIQQDAPGLVLRLPLYQRHRPRDTVEQRRAAFRGLVCGVFRTVDLMKAVRPSADWAQLRWTVSDLGAPGTSGTPLPLFDSAQHVHPAFAIDQAPADDDVRHSELTVAGRRWALSVSRAPLTPLLDAYPLALLLVGLTTTLGLWATLRSATARQAHAAAWAQRLSERAISSEHRLRAVLDNTIDGILVISREGHILDANQAVCRIFGEAQAQIIDQHLSRLIPAVKPDADRHAVETFLQLQQVGLDGLGRRTEGRRAPGMTFPLDLAVSQMEWEGETQYIAVVRDLSAQEAADRAILEAQRQLNEVDEMRRVIVHNAPYAIFVLNPHGVIQAVNPAGERLLGYKAHELIGRSTTQRFFDPDQITERSQLLALRLNEPTGEFDVLTHLAQESPGLPTEWRMRRADGSALVAEVLVTVLSNEYGELTGYLAMAHDVTLRREAESQLQHMALHDALTTLPNRNMLQEQLKASLQIAEREQHPLALMFLDLDRFKKINDSLGHHIGDTVLIEVARRLRRTMRTSDIVARLGGDEFVVLLPHITAQADGEFVAHKVLELFAEPFRVGTHELRVTPSIGMVIYPQHGTDAITLMRHADLAMYQAKNLGRNRVQLYSEQMTSTSADALVLENDLYHALERDELRLYLQPQFDCATGRIIGAEALLRWWHGGRLVSPSDFIPLAEETGLIVPMGEWVLRRACTLAHGWHQQVGSPLRIAVNLSAVQLDREDVADTVARVLHDTGLPPTALELEITESVVVRESLRAADVLRQLRALGVSIAIDDFGVGYSSFAYLRELPVDRLKLDRSFLAQVPQSTGDSRLVGALIAMAHRLEVGLVAEGVETEEQAAFLRDHGCDEAQGYHLGRPMTEAAFEALLLAHHQVDSALRPHGSKAVT